MLWVGLIDGKRDGRLRGWPFAKKNPKKTPTREADSEGPFLSGLGANGMPRRPLVDFLIVVALDDELAAAIRHLGPVQSVGREHFATVPRRRGSEFRVAIVNIGEMGPDAAQRETAQALQRVRAQRVILIGIAAGFPEDGVRLGDLMIPYRVVGYEASKVKETRFPFFRRLTFDHRQTPEPVSSTLWHAAKSVAESADGRWLSRVAVQRPDGTGQTPRVFADSKNALGCGSKIVASKLFEGRKWLRKEFPGILGLEMESIGVVNACRPTDTPVLVLKASQDPATADKDHRGEKDLWRAYACDVAAAFLRELVESFERSTESLVADHLARIESIVAAEQARETPLFEYRVSLAESYSDVRSRRFQVTGQPLEALLPNDAKPHIVLLGGGGTGKSSVARRLVRLAKNHDLCPVLLDLGMYDKASVEALRQTKWVDLTPEQRTEVEREVVDKLLAKTTVPRHDLAELRTLADETQLVCIIDGINEIPPVEQTLLLNALRALDPDDRGYVFVTARLGVREAFTGFAFASVDRLEESEVKALIDRRARVGAASIYDGLEPRLQQILRRPFFVSMAMKVGALEGLKDWSSFFARFFSERMAVGEAALAALAAATFESLDDVGGLDVATLRVRIGEREYAHLADAEVLARDERGFDHELWRDYLAAHHMAKHRELWIHDHFDRITVKASSYESLPLTMQQIAAADDRDRFVKAVYDWSLAGAVECLEQAEKSGGGEPTRGLKVAILSAIADKQFDAVWNTRASAVTQLREQRSNEARRFERLAARSDLVTAIAAEDVQDPWFERWIAIFSLSAGMPASPELLREIASEDSIIGWATANSLKRLSLTTYQIDELIALYRGAVADPTMKAIRWRVVHSLGSFATEYATAALVDALRLDSYMWVRYGAARSLIEAAAGRTVSVRARVIRELMDALPSVRGSTVLDRQRILREVLNSARIKGAGPTWATDVRPVLDLALTLADQQGRDELGRLLRAFIEDPEGLNDPE
jgi:nucleoside phosphorylase